jgi:hypothetical protein
LRGRAQASYVRTNRSDHPNAGRDGVLLAGLPVLIAAIVFVLAGRPWLTTDTLWALVWAGEIVNGEAPSFNDPQSATPHPLPNAVAVVLRLSGWWPAYWTFAALGLLLYGAMVAMTYAIGRTCFSAAVGVLAAVLVATVPALLDAGTLGHMDLAFIVLVLLAVHMEVLGRKPAAVMGVLSVAGLVRPEAWIFAGGYWLWCAVRGDQRLAWLACLAAAAPALWVLVDVIVTGSPLHSLTHTQEGAQSLERTTGLANVPGTAGGALRNLLTAPVLLGGGLGFIAAAVVVPRSRPLLAAGLLAGATYVAIGAANLSLIARYLWVPAIVLTIAFAFAVLGWRHHAEGVAQRTWAVAALAVALLAALWMPDRLDDLSRIRDNLANDANLVEELRVLADDPRAMRLLTQCDTLVVGDRRPRPLVSGALDRPIELVHDAHNIEPTRNAVFLTVRDQAIGRYALFPARPGQPSAGPMGERILYKRGVWEISSGSACRRRPSAG